MNDIKAVFRIRAFFPGSGSEFFSQSGSGSGSAKYPALIRKNPDPDPRKKRPKTGVKVDFFIFHI